MPPLAAAHSDPDLAPRWAAAARPAGGAIERATPLSRLRLAKTIHTLTTRLTVPHQHHDLSVKHSAVGCIHSFNVFQTHCKGRRRAHTVSAGTRSVMQAAGAPAPPAPRPLLWPLAPQPDVVRAAQKARGRARAPLPALPAGAHSGALGSTSRQAKRAWRGAPHTPPRRPLHHAPAQDDLYLEQLLSAVQDALARLTGPIPALHYARRALWGGRARARRERAARGGGRGRALRGAPLP
jgi:hypothetical protein